MSSPDKCYVCLRITPTKIFKIVHDVISDKKFAYNVAIEITKIIKATYMKSPTIFCGRGETKIIAALIYLEGIKHNHKITQRHMSIKLCITEATIRRTRKHLLKKSKVIKDAYENEA